MKKWEFLLPNSLVNILRKAILGLLKSKFLALIQALLVPSQSKRKFIKSSWDWYKKRLRQESSRLGVLLCQDVLIISLTKSVTFGFGGNVRMR